MAQSLNASTETQFPTQHIHFDPDSGLKNRNEFEKIHGPHGAWLIERFGLGFKPQLPDTGLDVTD